jgi:hypothetical protein
MDGIGLIAPGPARNTVRRFARSASPDELLVNDRTGQRPSILDKHEPYLRERWNSGCTNAALLGQEIRARGYPGNCRQVRGSLARFRGNAAVPAPVPVPPKVRTVTGCARVRNLISWRNAKADRLPCSWFVGHSGADAAEVSVCEPGASRATACIGAAWSATNRRARRYS